MQILIGRRLRFSVRVTEFGTGTPVDADEIRLLLRNTSRPADPVQEYEPPDVVHDVVGSYWCDVTPGAPGLWAYRWQCTGAIEDATEGVFSVIPSRVV